MYRSGIALACAAMLALPVMAQVKIVDSKEKKSEVSTFVVGVSGMT